MPKVWLWDAVTFGEVLDASGRPGGSPPEGFPRYQYAGEWGYESGFLELQGTNPNLPAITLQHLGWRWYDPALGRFVQRDPLGIGAGLNVYLYASAGPTIALDPTGELWTWVTKVISQIPRVVVRVLVWIESHRGLKTVTKPRTIHPSWGPDNYGFWHSLNCVDPEPVIPWWLFNPNDPRNWWPPQGGGPNSGGGETGGLIV